jgi:endonuclease/exonuclease/phosphatase family metal-dependent hydrolase
LNNSQQKAEVKINEDLPTFTNWYVGLIGKMFNIIDYIFADDHLIARRFETISEFDSRAVLASDHRPVMTTFEYLPGGC